MGGQSGRPGVGGQGGARWEAEVGGRGGWEAEVGGPSERPKWEAKMRGHVRGPSERTK